MAPLPDSAATAASRARAMPVEGGSTWLAPDWLSRIAGASVALTRENTRVTFRIRWLGLPVRGRFDELTGTLVVPAHDPSQASVLVQISADSVCTGLAVRDRHLRGHRFLDATRYPLIAFRGGNVLRGAAALDVPGSLTIRDMTHTLVLHCRSRADAADVVRPVVVDAVRAMGMNDADRPMGVDVPSTDGRGPERRRAGLTLVGETSFNRAAFGIGASTGIARLDPLMAMVGQVVKVEVTVSVD